MKNVKWTDNILSKGATTIHGYFTTGDLRFLFSLCPSASFCPTFCHEKMGAYGYTLNYLDKVEDIGREEEKRGVHYPLTTKEHGYYFTFLEEDGKQLLAWLKERYPMKRGEGCW